MFKRVAVFGLGLLGGSICRALKKQNPGIVISAYGRDPAKLAPALKAKIVDSAGGFDDADLSGVELAVVSTPVDASIDIIRNILSGGALDPSAFVIDVGSVKESVVRAVDGLDRAGQFIGCHPMAGSEKMGFEHSRDDLYEGATVIITPHARNREIDIGLIRRFWEGLKSRTVVVTPEEHDLLAAYTSHLPHVAASSLVRVFESFRQGHEPSAGMELFIGKGFLDVTRVSSGSPDMWRDIVISNRGNIIAALDGMIGELDSVRKLLSDPGTDAGRVYDYFDGAKKIRDGFK
jgi:prephenate dehydrogenase